MSKQFLILMVVVLVGALLLTACGKSDGSKPAASSETANPAANAGPDADGDGLPDSAETVLGSDPNNADTDGDGQNDLADPDPMMAANPISETSTTQGFTIDTILVENNVDASGADAPDHLELSLTNTGSTDLTDFEVYYTISDPTTNTVQGYYRTLPGFTLPAGETKAIHFDNTGQPDHFGVNPNSLYYTDKNALVVEVTLHAKGFAPQTASVNKDAGGAEDTPD